MARAAALLLLLLACAGAAHGQRLGSRLLCAGRTPSGVAGLKAAPGNGQFSLSWQPVLCAATYRLTAQRTDVQNVSWGGGTGASGQGHRCLAGCLPCLCLAARGCTLQPLPRCPATTLPAPLPRPTSPARPPSPCPLPLRSPLQTNTLRFEVAAPGTTALVNNVANGASYRVTIAACNADLCSAPAVLEGVVPAPTAAAAGPATAAAGSAAGQVVQTLQTASARPAFKIPQKRAAPAA